MITIIDILKAIVLTEVSIIGSFIMFSYPWDMGTGFLIWGGLLATIIILSYKFGAFNFNENNGDANIHYFTLLINGIMINFGGYFVLMLILRSWFPISIGGL